MVAVEGALVGLNVIFLLHDGLCAMKTANAGSQLRLMVCFYATQYERAR